MSTKLTPSHREKHEAFVRHYCENHLLTADLKRGAHSGIFDAAHMVDAIRADLLATRRKSKERDAIEAVLKE